MIIDFDDILSKNKSNLIGYFKDNLFEYNGYDNLRYTSRALLENDKGEFGFLHIVGEDFFGKRDHLETCGGGMEENEETYQTIIREIKEETGYIAKDYQYIGNIIDTYNLINRITISSFFHVLIDINNKVKENRTEEENELIKELIWLKPSDAIEWLENKNENKCDILIQRRDLLALKYYLKNYSEK